MEMNVNTMARAGRPKVLCGGCLCHESDGTIRRRQNPKIPVFYGHDPYLWLARVERYFHARPADDREKLQAAIAAMEGEALDSYIFDPTVTWTSFKEGIVLSFQPEAIENPYHMILNIRQTGTVAEYRDVFETLTYFDKSLYAAISDELMRAFFTRGLVEEVKEELVRHKRQATLSDLMDKAQDIEERNLHLAKNRPRPNLMKLSAEISGRKVVVLVDSGAEHSLIAKKVVTELRLPMCETDIDVWFKFPGVCKGVVVKVQKDLEIVRDFFVTEQLTNGADIALGADWLKGLGKITANFRELTMEFVAEGKVVTLKGDPSL